MIQNLNVDTIGDLVRDGESVIRCLFTREAVRRLTRVEMGHIRIVCADGTEIYVDEDTPIEYESWCMDRGSLIFDHDKKICTEFDLIEFSDGETFSVAHQKGIA